MLLKRYESGATLEDVCRQYWDSRLEPASVRLEDLLTMSLIAVATGVASGLIVEMVKSLPKVTARFGQPSDMAKIEEAAARTSRMIEDFAILYAIHRARKQKPELESDVYGTVSAGGTLRSLVTTQEQTLPAPLTHLAKVSRGLILAESERGEKVEFVHTIGGLPLSPGLGFGEVVSLLDMSVAADDLGGEWRQFELRLSEQWYAERLKPMAWPDTIRPQNSPSPKVLILKSGGSSEIP